MVGVCGPIGAGTGQAITPASNGDDPTTTRTAQIEADPVNSFSGPGPPGGEPISPTATRTATVIIVRTAPPGWTSSSAPRDEFRPRTRQRIRR